MENKGNAFEGAFAGSRYKRWGKYLGFNQTFYKKALGSLAFSSPIKALDLGCGPGSLSYPLAQRVPAESEITGIDLSLDQINYAKKYTEQVSCKLQFIRGSMDELEYPDNYIDLIITSMAMHETPPTVRRKTIKEVSRVLKPKGKFLLVDWSKPKFGLWGVIWFPLVYWGKNNEDNWHNHYKELCQQEGLNCIEDSYINSITRRQLFEKI